MSSLNQWQETSAIINWFRKINKKNKCTFIQFDIEEFHPSVLKELLLKALIQRKTVENINGENINTIMHSRKSQ